MVLHDTNLNHKGKIRPNRSYATKLLFDVIQADKYINYDSSNDFLFSNIAAFKINKHTYNSILNLISSLTISWEYFPTEQEISLYTDVISNNYESQTIELWNRVIEQLRKTMRPQNKHHVNYHSIYIKKGSFIHWVYLIQMSIKYLFDNGAKSLILKIYRKNRNKKT